MMKKDKGRERRTAESSGPNAKKAQLPRGMFGEKGKREHLQYEEKKRWGSEAQTKRCGK